ncbi:VAN3-binding protein [Impatiens glandulifera]|uniref:VAN3-binding protein n=1 Tax=Impatiens glandulifera TaxID=253017 RepID=UPI001FB143E4|nr:VAN3-binding protein [Impatiens glandulifera]
MNRSRLPEKARSSAAAGDIVHLPESPRGPMEFLSRSWSASALLLSKALSTTSSSSAAAAISSKSPVSSLPIPPGDPAAALHQMKPISEDSAAIANANAFSFSFASSATSQLVLERIMSQSEISPLTSGRLSHSSEPLNGSSLTDGTDSPPISPSDEFDDVVKYLRSNNSLQPLFTGAPPRNGAGAAVNGSGVNTPGGKTVGRWLKERREKKKEENRAHNAQIHAAVSVASVAASVAAIAAATAAASATGKDEQTAKTDMAVASAATLVAAQCVEAAENMGAARELLIAAISSAVNVRSHGDISTLTAAAATALRGVATLKARAVKEVWNAAAEKGSGIRISGSFNPDHNHHPTVATNCLHGGEGIDSEENFLDACNQQLLARGTELLKRTRKGDLHLKIVSVYIHRTGQVMLKMKSKHVAGTITKKKKNVVFEVCKNLPSWPGRHLLEDGEQRRYFGLRTENRGLVEFECKNQREYDIWTHGVSRLLEIIAERNGIMK